MADDENRSEELIGEESEEATPVHGVNALLYSIADAIQSEKSKEVIAQIFKNYADDIRPHRQRGARMTVAGWAMTLLIIMAIGLFAYGKLINPETTAALLGIVIGGLYKRNGSN